jgi:uncharacterized protein (DUF3820 family)
MIVLPVIAYTFNFVTNLIMEEPKANPELLIQLVSMKMPFGKYKDRLLCDLPVHYLEWFQRKGFPQGKLGILLETIYEIKINGVEDLLKPLKNKK